jgi:hypothetical protein
MTYLLAAFITAGLLAFGLFWGPIALIAAMVILTAIYLVCAGVEGWAIKRGA